MSKKVVTMDQLLENARQSEELTMRVAAAAAASIEGKQDKLTGTAGQVVGFNEAGDAVAQPGVTMDMVNTAIQAAITGPFVICIDFSDNALGLPYTVSNGDEVYSSVVKQATGNFVFVRKNDVEYTVECEDLTRTVQSSDYGVIPRLMFNLMKCCVTITVSGATKVIAQHGDTILNAVPSGRNEFVVMINDPGSWSFEAYSGETSVGNKVQINLGIDETNITVDLVTGTIL